MLTLYGHSDDCAEADGLVMDVGGEPGIGRVGSEGSDEFGCCDAGIRFTVGSAASGGGVVATMRYGASDTGTWSATLEPLDEDVPIPWPVSVDARDYTIVVRIGAPDGTQVRVERV